MSGHYTLVGQTPVPCDCLVEWAKWFETADRRVAQTYCWRGLCRVSTVFLGLDHSYGALLGLEGVPPLLFETMVFWGSEGGYEIQRCSTWPEAEAQHAAFVAHARRLRSLLAWLWRRLVRR
jgi:hypothetical protein